MSHPRRVTVVTIAAVLVVVIALVVGVFVVLNKKSSSEHIISADGKIAWSRLTVASSDGDQRLSLRAAHLSQGAFDTMRSLTDAGALVGTPVEITADGDIPADGIRITKTYAAPLPRDMSATLAYFDTAFGGWKAVPSKVAADRRSVTAVVDHLSIWNDIVSGADKARKGFVDATKAAGDVVVSAASKAYSGVQAFNRKTLEVFQKSGDALYYGVGKVFDTRVDSPTCHGDPPDWVDTVTFIKTHFSNPILWCAGRDAKQSNLVEVKARVNRGYGFSYSTSTTPTWSHNSGLDVDAFDDALNAVTSLDKVLAKSVREITSGDHLVGPGDEISFGFTEKAVRAAAGKPLVELNVLPVTGFLATSLAGIISNYGVSQADGWLGAVIAVASCSRDVTQTAELLSAAHAVLTCMQAADDDIARHLATAMLKRGGDPKTIGRKARVIVTKGSIGLGLIGPVFSGMSYTAERHIDAGARRLTVFPTQNVMSNWTIGPGTLGPIRVGMTARQLQALGYAAPYDDEDGSFCGITWKSTDVFEKSGATLAPHPHLDPNILSDIYAGGYDGGPGFSTDKGIKVGSTVADLKKAYGSRLVSKNTAFGEEESVPVFVVFGPNGALTFFPDSEPVPTVYSIYATRGTTWESYVVPFMDGC